MRFNPGFTVLTTLALLLLVPLGREAHAQAVLEIDGISGDSQLDGYVDAIEVLSFAAQSSRSVEQQSSSLAVLAPLTVTKYADSATTPLANASLGNALPSWKLSVLEAGASKLRPAMTLELCDVFVTNYNISAGSDSRPLEEVTFVYGGYRLGINKQSTNGDGSDDFDYIQAEIGAPATCQVNGSTADIDSDNDGVLDPDDNCPAASNPDQSNFDGDSEGDACDSDDDNDGFADSEDHFPYDATEWLDTDGDGVGNNADPDDDGDGFLDDEESAAGSDPLDGNSTPSAPALGGDLNGDGVVNVSDVLLGQQLLRGERELTQEYLDRGDVAPVVSGEPQPDGIFNLGDLLIIQRKALNP